MNRVFFLFPVAAVILAACNPVSERECGVFDHPEFSQWQSQDLPAQVSFMNDAGATINFTREPVVLNEPFLGTDGASNDEDVVCNLEARVRLLASDNTLAITSIFIQPEALLLDSDQEPLRVDHVIEAPVGATLDGDFPADISIGRPRFNLDATRVTYLEEEETEDASEETDAPETSDTQEPEEMTVLSEEIGGQSYDDVVRIDSAVPLPEPLQDGTLPIGIRQIVLARDFGVVAFTDNNDSEIVRLP